MGTMQDRDRVELIRVELERKQKDLDGLMHNETLHPSAAAALQMQMEEEIEKLRAELQALTVVTQP